MVEEWRPVVGYEGWYEVSSLGRVRRGDRIRKTPKNTHGYPALLLSKQNVKSPRLVHRLVAESFLGPAPKGKTWVLHGDGSRDNNRASNLRWGNRSDNVRDSVRDGTHAESRKTHCKRGHPLNPGTRQRVCPVCQSARNSTWRNRRPQLDSSDPRHSSHSGYVAGCREQCCREAHNEYEKKRRAANRG